MKLEAQSLRSSLWQLLRVFGRAWRLRRAAIASEQLAWVPPVSRDVCPYLPPAKCCDEKPRDWLLG
ncbi:MAG: hypothetical protein AAGJ31_04950, partial [Verrucomicrobiota bacterium]